MQLLHSFHTVGAVVWVINMGDNGEGIDRIEVDTSGGWYILLLGGGNIQQGGRDVVPPTRSEGAEGSRPTLAG